MSPSAHDKLFWQALEWIDEGDADSLRSHLRAYPHLVCSTAPPQDPPWAEYFSAPTLVHFLPDNPIRTGRVTEGCADCLDVLVGMGAPKAALEETLALACSSQSLHDSGQDTRLIPALIQAGATPESGVSAALGHKAPMALSLLIESGARYTLSIRAALGEELSPAEVNAATKAELQEALAVAAIWGQSQDVRLLADAGADLDSCCPPGFHPHSSPLHQAVISGSRETVLALLEAGADPLVRDKLWGASPLGWAEHMGLIEMADLLGPWQKRGSHH